MVAFTHRLAMLSLHLVARACDGGCLPTTTGEFTCVVGSSIDSLGLSDTDGEGVVSSDALSVSSVCLL